jgi:hypothetical protein
MPGGGARLARSINLIFVHQWLSPDETIDMSESTQLGVSGPVGDAGRNDTSLSPWLHLVRIYIEPSPTFKELAARPSFLPPLLGLAIIALAKPYFLFEPSREPAKIVLTWLLEFVPLLLIVGVVVGALAGILALMNADAPFRSILSVLLHTFFAFKAVLLVVAVAAVVLGADLDAVRFNRIGFTNLSGFVDPSQFALHRLLRAFDVLVLAHLWLITLGLYAVARGSSRRPQLTLAAVGSAVVGVWLAYVVVVVGIKVAVQG